MSRPLRNVRPDGTCFEITTRVMQGRFLLPPGDHFRRIAIGILARAKELYPIELYGFCGLSNHVHLLVGAQDVDLLAGFMCHLKSNLAREAGRIVGWREKFWGQRYRAIEISDEEEAWVARLRYLLSHGVKENLVLCCRDWPGLQCIDALTTGKPLEGVWIDRTRRTATGEPTNHSYVLELDPIPCWRHLSKQEHQARIAGLVTEIDEENAERIVLGGGAPPLGIEAILAQDPHDKPEDFEPKPAPGFHAATRSVRALMKEAYRLFVEAYRAAAKRLRAGDLTVEFPPGCFPPPRRFVSARNGTSAPRDGPL